MTSMVDCVLRTKHPCPQPDDANGADDNGADDDDDDDNGADDDAAHAHVDAVVRLSQIGVRQTLRKQSSQTELNEPGCCPTQAT